MASIFPHGPLVLWATMVSWCHAGFLLPSTWFLDEVFGLLLKGVHFPLFVLSEPMYFLSKRVRRDLNSPVSWPWGLLFCPCSSSTCYTCGMNNTGVLCFVVCVWERWPQGCVLLMLFSDWAILFSLFAPAVCHAQIGFCHSSCLCYCHGDVATIGCC